MDSAIVERSINSSDLTPEGDLEMQNTVNKPDDFAPLASVSEESNDDLRINKDRKIAPVPRLNLSLCLCSTDDSGKADSLSLSRSLSSNSNDKPTFRSLSSSSSSSKPLFAFLPSPIASPSSSPSRSSKSKKQQQLSSPMSPRRRRKKEREVLIRKVVHVVSSPFPYMILILLVAMIVMMFVDIMPISALICVSAMCMVVSVVVGNHWRHKKVCFP